MERSDRKGHDPGNMVDEDWVEPFRRALALHGRPGDNTSGTSYGQGNLQDG